MPRLVDDTVQHTNAYAYIEVANENSTTRRYNPMGAGETLRLIGVLLMLKEVQNGIGAKQLCSTASGQDLSCPGRGLETLWPH